MMPNTKVRLVNGNILVGAINLVLIGGNKLASFAGFEC
jgi:hypothetical protein